MISEVILKDQWLSDAPPAIESVAGFPILRAPFGFAEAKPHLAPRLGGASC